MEGITEPLYDLLHLIKFKRQTKTKNRKFATNRRKSKRNIDKKIK
jgi:hypothetical protein